MTNAELSILSLIIERPRHGYEIEQVIQERGMREWTEVGFSSIYYLLKKLEQAGLIASHLQDARQGPARRVYEPTPAGAEALRAGVIEALSTPRRAYPSLQLGLANLPGLQPAEAHAALRRYRAALAARLADVQTNWMRGLPLPYFIEAMFDYSVTMLDAEIEWVDRFIAHLETMPEDTTVPVKVPGAAQDSL